MVGTAQWIAVYQGVVISVIQVCSPGKAGKRAAITERTTVAGFREVGQLVAGEISVDRIGETDCRGRSAVQALEVPVAAFLVARILVDGQARQRLPLQLQLSAPDFRFGNVDQLANIPHIGIDPHLGLELLVAVVIVEHRAIEPQGLAQVALEADLIGQQLFRLEGLDQARRQSSIGVVGGETTGFDATADAGIQQVAIGRTPFDGQLGRGFLAIEAGIQWRGTGIDVARDIVVQIALFMLTAHTEHQGPGVGQGVAALAEQAAGPGLLLVFGEIDVAQAAVFGEVGEELLVEPFAAIVAASYPVQTPVALGCQANLLGEDLDVGIEELVGLSDVRAVPIDVFLAIQRVVGADAGQRQMIVERPVGGQREAPVGVVTVRLVTDRQTGDSGEFRPEVPAGMMVAAVDGNARIAGLPVDVARLQSLVQARTTAVGTVAPEVGPQVEAQFVAGIPLQLSAEGGYILVTKLLASIAVFLPGATILAGNGQAAAQGVGDWTGNEPLQRLVAVGAVAALDLGLEGIGRPAADEIDRPAGTVATVQGALGTAQYLYPLQIEQQTLALDREGVGNLVDIDSHGGGVVGGVVAQTDAANAELGLFAAIYRVDLQVGHLI